LLSKEGIPNNESIEDTFDDQAMYTILWGARYRRDKVERNQTPYLNPGGDLDQKSSFYPNANEFK
jgi:hypothetical protein